MLSSQARAGVRGFFLEREIKETVLTARCWRGQLAVVRFADGGWGITRDEERVDAYYWPESMLDGCIDTFLRLAEVPVEEE
ncbi:MAG TPA: hypothetical protein VER17_09400 [Tepidisphaeraceae bacterium]|nr:hypothetical protein [Tepidisphaeraceae bacterium]